MANSGIDVSQEIVDAYYAMKKVDRGKSNPDKDALLVLKIDIEKEELNLRRDLCRKTCTHAEMEEFLSKDMKKECCYVVFEHNNKLILIKWVPDGEVKVKEKMLCSSTFSAIKSKFEGVKYLEACDADDITEDALKNAKSG